MNLPPLTIPDLPLPFLVPPMMHPAIVHFAVALPVIIILLEVVNLLVRRRVIGSVSFGLMVLMSVVYLGAYLTGHVDAHEAGKALTPETKSLLEAHTTGGIWMVYGSVVVLIFKLISVTVKRVPARIAYLVVLGLFFWGATGVTQRGCALVYKHGVNVHKDAPVTQPVPPAQPAAKPVAVPEKTTADAAVPPKTSAPQTVETVKAKAAEVVETVKKTTANMVKKAADSVNEAREKAEKAVEKAVKPLKVTPAEQIPATPAQPVTPVETVPAG